MAKTKHLGLNLTEDESTKFTDWRKSIDGNNADGEKSNMQLIDDAIADTEKDIAVLHNALMQGGITYKADTETEYNERITADGLNVLDGSKAVLKKVVGNTVKSRNLIPFPYFETTRTVSGITFTVQADGGVSVKGTATGGSLILLATPFNLFSEPITVVANGTAVVKDGYCMSATAVMKSGDAPTFGYSIGSGGDGYIYVSVTMNRDYDCVVYPMINKGETALPYEPYFEGLKNASFAGIESTGRNLIPFPYRAVQSTSNGVTFTSNVDGSIIVNGQNNGNGDSAYHLLVSGVPFVMKAGIPYTLSIETNSIDINGTLTAKGVYYTANKENKKTLSFTEDTTISSIYIQVNKGNTANLVNEVVRIMFNAGTTALPYEPYIEPTVFDFPKTELGKWDSIDFENQKVVVGTQTVVFDGTENWILQSVNDIGIHNFNLNLSVDVRYGQGICNLYKKDDTSIANATSEGFLTTGRNLFIRSKSYTTVADWKAYLAELYASGKPLVIAYELATPTETPFTADQSASGNEYRAYSGGTERVLENDGNEYGADNTLSQNYIVVKE